MVTLPDDTNVHFSASTRSMKAQLVLYSGSNGKRYIFDTVIRHPFHKMITSSHFIMEKNQQRQTRNSQPNLRCNLDTRCQVFRLFVGHMRLLWNSLVLKMCFIPWCDANHYWRNAHLSRWFNLPGSPFILKAVTKCSFSFCYHYLFTKRYCQRIKKTSWAVCPTKAIFNLNRMQYVSR